MSAFNLFKPYDPAFLVNGEENNLETEENVTKQAEVILPRAKPILTNWKFLEDANEGLDYTGYVNNDEEITTVLDSNRTPVVGMNVNGPHCVKRYSEISSYSASKNEKTGLIQTTGSAQYVQNRGIISKSDLHSKSFFIVLCKPQSALKTVADQRNIDIDFAQYNLKQFTEILTSYKGDESRVFSARSEYLSNIKLSENLKLLKIKSGTINSIPKNSYVYIIGLTSDFPIPMQLQMMMTPRNTVYVNRAVLSELSGSKHIHKFNECLLFKNSPLPVSLVEIGFNPQSMVIKNLPSEIKENMMQTGGEDKQFTDISDAAKQFWEWFSSVVTA